MAEEIRAVINQTGVAMELHGRAGGPVILGLVSVPMLASWRAHLVESNPDMRYATIGYLAVELARKMFDGGGVVVSPHAWTCNASENSYVRA